MRIGIDLGGTKTEILVLDRQGTERWRMRIATPKTYPELLAALAGLVKEADSRAGGHCAVGVAIPGSESSGSNRIKNANTLFLNGKPLRADLEAALMRDVRLSNDANCFVLSEATDGAAADARVVFGVIAGTGLGGGIAIDRRVLTGAHGVAGEWGHIPLPAMTAEEIADNRACYCGKSNCLETWCCGPALVADYRRHFLVGPLRPPRARALADSPSSAAREGEAGPGLTAKQIAESDEPAARAAVARLTDRLARGLAVIVNILDPDVIVLGGGLSNVDTLYRDLPALVEHYGFTLGGPPRIVKNRHGDSSGVRGAAWLWPDRAPTQPPQSAAAKTPNASSSTAAATASSK
jgi:fructokinase